MKYVVLGGTGFIGSAVRDRLLRQGHSVTVFDRASGPVLATRDVDCNYVQGDFSEQRDWRPLLHNCDALFHCISATTPRTSDADPEYDLQANVAASVRLMQQVSGTETKVVFVSSAGAIYGRTEERQIEETHPTEPISAYGIGKLAIEKYLQLFRYKDDLRYAVARVSNPFGEGQNVARPQGVVGVFLSRALKGETIEIWGDGHVVRDYIYVEDVAEALVRLVHYDGESPVFNIGTGEGRSLRDIVSAISQISGREISPVFQPARREDPDYNVVSIEKAKRLLGWSPLVSFEKALERTYRWVALRLEDEAYAFVTRAPSGD